MMKRLLIGILIVQFSAEAQSLVFVRASHAKLEAEAKPFIGLLPKFIQEDYKGEFSSPYSLKLLFNVNNNETGTASKTPIYKEFIQDLKNINKQDKDIPFAEVEKAPTFDACENIASENKRKTCTYDTVTSLVLKNLNLELAEEIGLKRIQRIVSFFTFGKDGSIQDLDIKAPHPKLVEETERVIKLLPNFSPGEHKGKKVNVRFKLPIEFQVSD